jgi:hypothetical protein
LYLFCDTFAAACRGPILPPAIACMTNYPKSSQNLRYERNLVHNVLVEIVFGSIEYFAQEVAARITKSFPQRG